MPGANDLRTGYAREMALQLSEGIRKACLDAAIDGYERASISGLCHEGAWEAAVSAIRMVVLESIVERAAEADSEVRGGAEAEGAAESLRDVALRLARRFASPGVPAAGSAAAGTGAIAAGLLERTATLSALRGPEGFRKRAHSIASRGAVLQSSLSSLAGFDAELEERLVRAPLEGRVVGPEDSAVSPVAQGSATDSALEVAARCAQVTTLGAEVARDGQAAVRRDAASAQRLAASATECALTLVEENLRAAVETDWIRSAKRRIWRTRLLLLRVRPAIVDRGSV